MIKRKSEPRSEGDGPKRPKGFDDFEIRLGDLMRGERATMGKSLLDVQRDLRIKACYIAAIENADPSVFDTPGFVAGYVRAYARYLGMDPEEAFQAFCRESGFSIGHGLPLASGPSGRGRRESPGGRARPGRQDPAMAPFSGMRTPFVPEDEGFLSRIEPRAIGSALVLLLLIGGIGYGGWAVLKEIQQVQLAPVDQAPVVLSDLDPLEGALSPAPDGAEDPAAAAASARALERLYRPQALDLPILVARDAPISTLDPRRVGLFRAPEPPQVQRTAEQQRPPEPVPQVVEPEAPKLAIVAVRPSWVRVSAADGTVIFEGIMEGGQSWEVPAMEEPPTLRAGESGAVYFAVNGRHYGPVGRRGVVTSNLPLSVEAVTERFQLADLEKDRDLARMVAEAETTDPAAD